MTLLSSRRWLLGPEKGAYRRELVAAAHERNYWRAVWRDASEGCGLTRTVAVAAGETVIVPPLVSVAGSPTTLVVQLLPGQLPADVQAVADRLAPALGAARLRIRGLSDGQHVRIECLDKDPLDGTFTYPLAPPPGLIGVAEDRTTLAVPWPQRGHMIAQGQTGSGKSVWTYGQLVDAANDPAVLVTGLDPSGLLWRPFAGTRHADWLVSGVGGDLEAHVALLERLVDLMDARIAAMPADRDAVQTSAELPTVLVVLEELAGLYRAAGVVDRKVETRLRSLVGRLLAEGRKAGIRCLLIVQRADAVIVDGATRAQCAMRISFSVDSAEAVRMLHPAAADTVTDVLNAAPGVATLTMPGQPLTRFRAPLLDYPTYCALVGGASS